MPKVSVIIPVYNVENYLKKCLDSVINQTLKDIEIICINDGSTDSSLDILNEYAKKDNRIIVINQENKGISEARNNGIKIAKGEYIGFIDSDDYIDLNFYEKLYYAAKKDDYDIAYASIYRQNKNKYFLQIKKEIVSKKQYAKYKNTMIPKYNYVWNKIYKNSLLKEKFLLFPPNVYYEDILWSFLIIYYSKKIISVPNTNYYYEYNSNSIVCQKTEKHKNDYINGIKSIQDFAAINRIKCPLKYFVPLDRKFIYLFSIRLFTIVNYKYIKIFYLFNFIPILKITTIPKKNLII